MSFKNSQDYIKYKQYQGVMLFENLIKEQLLTVKQLAQLLNVSARTLRDWTLKRKIPFLKINGAVRFSAPAIAQWVIAEGSNGNTNVKI
jgi:excisionase family DNA binding protein